MSSIKKLILVFGGTGAQGTHVIDALLAPSADGEPSPYAVRALTRDPSSRRAMELTAKGVECVKGSVDDFASIRSAFEGVYGAYVNTDGFTVGEQKEVYVNMHIFDLAKQAKSVRHYVFSGLDDTMKLSGYNPDYEVDHFTGKARVADWLKAQPSIANDSELSWSVINTCLYMDMLKISPMVGPITRRPDGTFVFASAVGDGHVAMIALADIGFFARYTFDHRAETSAKNLNIAGEMVGWENLVKAFTKVTGQPAVYKRQTLDEWWTNFTGVDRPVASEKSYGDGSTTAKENFSAFWRMWRDDIIKRDINWVRSIHPKLQSIEDFMRNTGYDGILSEPSVLKNVADGKETIRVNADNVKLL